MIARRTLLGKGLAIALALSGCKVGESPSYRYKLTINVETPEGISSAHSVIAVQFFGTMKGFEALGGGSAERPSHSTYPMVRPFLYCCDQSSAKTGQLRRTGGVIPSHQTNLRRQPNFMKP